MNGSAIPGPGERDATVAATPSAVAKLAPAQATETDLLAGCVRAREMDLDEVTAAHVRRALELAREAGDRGDGPYGSVLVRDGAVVATATNRERTEDDMTLHPELTLARRAAREDDAAARARTAMVTSTEPCSMCATGVAYAGLGGVVYSVAGETAADRFGTAPGIPCGEVFDRHGADVAVRGSVLEDEGMAVHERYRSW